MELGDGGCHHCVNPSFVLLSVGEFGLGVSRLIDVGLSEGLTTQLSILAGTTQMGFFQLLGDLVGVGVFNILLLNGFVANHAVVFLELEITHF